MAKASRPVAPLVARPPAVPSSAGQSLLWMQGALCGVLVAVVTPTAVLLGALLAPALVSLALDRAAGRPVARAMLLFGLAGAVGPLLSLWRGGHTIELAMALALDPATLMPAWTAEAAGWLLTQMLPLLIRAGLEYGAVTRRLRLGQLRRRCEEQWVQPPGDEAVQTAPS